MPGSSRLSDLGCVPLTLLVAIGCIGWVLKLSIMLLRAALWPLQAVWRAVCGAGGRKAPSALAAHSHGVLDVIDVAGVRTELLTWSPRSPAPPGAPTPVFIMLPGNPGAVSFYDAYLDRLYEQSGGTLTIMCVGHASHSAASASSARYDLTAQIAHKAQFVRHVLQHTPSARLTLAGHSVGAFMAVELLRCEDILAATDRAVLLFPTLANIRMTVNGTALTPVFQYLRSAAWAVTWLVSLSPHVLQRAVARVFMPGADESSVHAALTLVHPDVAYAALYMALHEMRQIVALDDAHMQQVQEKCVMYFASKDDWVNEADIEHMQRSLKKAQVHRCTEGHRHAFVLSKHSSVRVADRTWSWIQPVVTKQA